MHNKVRKKLKKEKLSATLNKVSDEQIKNKMKTKGYSRADFIGLERLSPGENNEKRVLVKVKNEGEKAIIFYCKSGEIVGVELLD